MTIHKLNEADGKGIFLTSDAKDVEQISPIKHFSEKFISKIIILRKEMLLLEKPPFQINNPLEAMLFIEGINNVVVEKAFNSWNENYREILNTVVPKELLALLNSRKKSEQEKILRGFKFTAKEFLAFIFKAYLDFGFKFSSYKGEHHHAGLNQSDLPQLITIKDGQVLKVGKTVLTDGELKQVILGRKVTVSRFLDNGDCWHCFFVTFASLRGQETWNDGQPHFHYISDKFGIPRDKVVTMLKSDKYKLGSLPHLNYIDIN